MLSTMGAPLEDKKNTLASHLVDKLREEILAGNLKPGTKLNVESIRKNFDVSLSPLREALARLIAVGLVELHDNKGYSIAPISLTNLSEITQLRIDLENLALRYAIATGEIEWESDVMRALYKLNRTIRDPKDVKSLDAWERAHRDFHLTLIQGCKMPMLINFCDILHNLNDRYRRIFLIERGGDRNVAAEHNDIALAAVARDSDVACDRLREHIHRTGNNLKSILSGQIPA